MALTWPDLPLEPWRPTQETLHLWTQVVGKVRLALTDLTNHWWSCTFQVTPRGLTTGVMHHGSTPVEIAFDFVGHRLVVDVAAERRMLALEPRSVADFHAELLATLSELGAGVRIDPMPQEVADAVPFSDDDLHADYDPASVQRFHRALVLADQALRRWRAPFLGKCSPVHFFWGAFDLAVTRFSGRDAPQHPGGVPAVADWVVREAYSHECTSAGWWPGNGGFGRAAFYAYAYPEPEGYRQGAELPPGAFYDPALREYLLPWEDVIAAPDPEVVVADFLQATYAAAAAPAAWDATLVRPAEDLETLRRLLRSVDQPLL